MGNWRRVAAVLVAGALALAGCGRAAPAPAPSAGQAYKQKATLDVTLTEFRIEPATLTVARDTQVTLQVTNRGHLVHDLAIPALDAATPALRPGMKTTLTFVASQPGEYEVVCQIPGHKTQGMKARLVVE